MATSQEQHDENLAWINAQGQWSSNLAWGFAALAAIAALLIWAVFGNRETQPPAVQGIPPAAPAAK